MTDPIVTVTYLPSKEAHMRAGLLSYMVANGSTHGPLNAWGWDAPICPLCTYEAADVLTGVPWPCDKTEA